MENEKHQTSTFTVGYNIHLPSISIHSADKLKMTIRVYTGLKIVRGELESGFRKRITIISKWCNEI